MTFLLIILLVAIAMVGATVWSLIRHADTPRRVPRSHAFDPQLAPPSAR